MVGFLVEGHKFKIILIISSLLSDRFTQIGGYVIAVLHMGFGAVLFHNHEIS